MCNFKSKNFSNFNSSSNSYINEVKISEFRKFLILLFFLSSGCSLVGTNGNFDKNSQLQSIETLTEHTLVKKNKHHSSSGSEDHQGMIEFTHSVTEDDHSEDHKISQVITLKVDEKGHYTNDQPILLPLPLPADIHFFYQPKTELNHGKLSAKAIWNDKLIPLNAHSTFERPKDQSDSDSPHPLKMTIKDINKALSDASSNSARVEIKFDNNQLDRHFNLKFRTALGTLDVKEIPVKNGQNRRLIVSPATKAIELMQFKIANPTQYDLVYTIPRRQSGSFVQLLHTHWYKQGTCKIKEGDSYSTPKLSEELIVRDVTESDDTFITTALKTNETSGDKKSSPDPNLNLIGTIKAGRTLHLALYTLISSEFPNPREVGFSYPENRQTLFGGCNYPCKKKTIDYLVCHDHQYCEFHRQERDHWNSMRGGNYCSDHGMPGWIEKHNLDFPDTCCSLNYISECKENGECVDHSLHNWASQRHGLKRHGRFTSPIQRNECIENWTVKTQEQILEDITTIQGTYVGVDVLFKDAQISYKDIDFVSKHQVNSIELKNFKRVIDGEFDFENIKKEED